MQSTASGKDSVLFSGDFSRAVVFVCRKKLLRQTSALYIPYLYGEPSPRGLPKTGGHGILQYIIVER